MLHVDFNSEKLTYRRLHGGGKGQGIAKAIGIKRYDLPLKVIDATAGLGTDAFILASLGCNVIMYERNKEVANALQEGLSNAALNPNTKSIVARMQLIINDARISLANLEHDLPDVIYLDPMFPKRKNSALVKKDMQYLQKIVGSDLDAEELLQLALQKAKKRVVVKRSKLAPNLGSTKPDLQLTGSSSRFDIYTAISLSNN